MIDEEKMEVNEFLKKMTELIAKKFDKQKLAVEDIESDVRDLKITTTQLERKLELLQEKVDELSEKKKEIISSDVLESLE